MSSRSSSVAASVVTVIVFSGTCNGELVVMLGALLVVAVASPGALAFPPPTTRTWKAYRVPLARPLTVYPASFPSPAALFGIPVHADG